MEVDAKGRIIQRGEMQVARALGKRIGKGKVEPVAEGEEQERAYLLLRGRSQRDPR